MNVEILARIQFAFTIGFHYIYPPLSIGLGLILVITEGLYLKKPIFIFGTIRNKESIYPSAFAHGLA
jgi:cytochrome bd-type quinol oxidase subunit 1